MKKTLLILVMIFSSHCAKADDVEKVYILGETAKKTGLITGYKVSGWSQSLDLYVGSNYPSDARAVAEAVCKAAKENARFENPWDVRVFLIVGERPAAVCKTK